MRNIEMQYGSNESEIDYAKWDIAIVGNPVDERGKQSTDFVLQNSVDGIIAYYDPVSFMFGLGETSFIVDDIDIHIKKLQTKLIVLDATTLSFADLLLLMKSFLNNDIVKFDVFYLEPKIYNRKKNNILNTRDFDLSDDIIGYSAIPGYALSISKDESQHVVFICGYESERIDRAIEESQISPDLCSSIFGVPAYRAGWEIDSFSNNIAVIKERRLSNNISFCAADNPLAVYLRLNEINTSLDEKTQLFIAPLSCKPMNIGACLFLISESNLKAAALYDHPSERVGRSKKVSKWHLYNIEL